MGQIQTKCMKNKRNQKFENKEEIFMKNGAIFLEKQINLSQGQCIGTRLLKIFSKEDIQKATYNYSPDLIIGRSVTSGHRIVYKATLEERMVSIGAPSQSKPNPKLTDRYLTEAAMAMIMNHDNMVKLHGCCLETIVPILVHEYVPNGSLFQHLHRDNIIVACNYKHIKWADRLRVAIDVAYALSYMHNALSKPIVHRGLNSSMILIDESYHAKFGNFGLSVLITPGETSQKWPIEGTPGYIDPEYIETQEVTDKCDVYGFGVLMLEMLTRRHPLSVTNGGKDLANDFVRAVVDNCMMEMIDNEVLEQASVDDIKLAANIALKCVARKGVERPTMIEVVEELWLIQGPSKKKNENME